MIKTRQDILIQINETIKSGESFLIVSHVDPDGDAIGSQLAFGRYLTDLGKNVLMVRDSVIPSKYRFLPGVAKIVDTATINEIPEFDSALILECPGWPRVGKAADWIGPNKKIITLDHHLESKELGEVNWIDVTASSVGEMAFEYFLSDGYRIDKDVATLLYTAIMTDTGRFRFESTTPRTMTIVGELIKAGANPRTICNEVYFNMDPSVLKLTGKVLDSMELHADGRICLLSLTNKMLNDTGADKSASEGLVDFTLFNRGVIVGALLKEAENNHTRISLRSSDGINVSQIASQFGGGGHFNAAGLTIEQPIDDAKRVILELLENALAKN